jgi:tetratricopeptide (TPR) repeat protein
MNMRALISLANNDASGAMELFQRALKLDPGNVSVRMNLGVSYLRFRQLGAASVQFERVLKLNPDHADALLHLAVIKSARGEHESAEKIYEDVLADKLNNPLALYNLAVLQQRTGEFDASLNNLKTYLKTAPARTEDTNQALMLIERIKDLRNQVRQSGADEDQDIETMVARQQERDAEDSKKSKPNDEDAANSDDARDPELMDLEDQLID